MKKVAAPPAGKCVILVVAAFVIGLGISRAAEEIGAPEKIALTPYNRGAGVVTFAHKDHGATGLEKPDCAFCHHTTAWGQTPEKCSDCHKPPGESDDSSDIAAFHKLCIYCHMGEIDRGNKRVSPGCEGCHTPEE